MVEGGDEAVWRVNYFILAPVCSSKLHQDGFTQ